MAEIYNIFLAKELQKSSCGYLTGYTSSGLICVLGITPTVVNSERIVGYWGGTQTSKIREAAINKLLKVKRLDHGDGLDKYVLLLKNDSPNSISSKIYVSSHRDCLSEIPTVLIYFKPCDYLQSYLFAQRCSTKCIEESDTVKGNGKLNLEVCDDSIGEKVAILTDSFLKQPCLPGEVILWKERASLECVNVCYKFLLSVSLFFIWTLSCLWRARTGRIVKDCLSVSSLCQLIQDKCRRCHQVNSLKDSAFRRFLTHNISAQHVVDCLAGLAILYFILTLGLTDVIAFSTLDWADDVANRLINLTQWLMGAPAGLKLNAELTTFLGHFYIYQIYVWTGYLVFMRSAMSWLILFGVWTGAFGLSVLLCFVKDVISLLTVHIYCFYVYAARIFNLQVNALSSLWKLFRGKKWNVLRNRVDSAEYDTDQLFLGTLLFTVLLFLLPTTLLYYAVFTSLRLLSLMVQGFLSGIVMFINELPVYTLMLRLLRPKLIAGATLFKTMDYSNDPSNLVLNMETSQLPLKEVIALTAPYMCPPRKYRYSWGKLLSCIAKGELIYPWMESPNGKE